MKICSKCEIEKELGEFNKNKQNKDGLCGTCKNCRKEYLKEYYKENTEVIKKYQKENAEKIKKQKEEYRKENKERTKEYNKEYWKNNKEKSLEYRKEYIKEYSEKNSEKIKKQKQKYYEENSEKIKQKSKEYRLNNVEKINEYFKERYKNDPQFRIACNLRSRNNKVIIAQGGIKSASTEELLGCSFEFARAYIESLFEPGMSWDNHGEWEIDHIRPCASFDLTDPKQQKLCSHYTNLCPLWATDNRSKSSVYKGVKHYYKEKRPLITALNQAKEKI